MTRRKAALTVSMLIAIVGLAGFVAVALGTTVAGAGTDTFVSVPGGSADVHIGDIAAGPLEIQQTGQITGRVTSAAGVALQNATVSVYNSRTSTSPVISTSTDAAGNYAISGLVTGTYFIGFARTEYVPEFYNNRAGQSTADGVSVTSGAPASNINAALDRYGRITGQVTETVGSASLPNVSVYVYDRNTVALTESIQLVSTDSSGNYVVDNLVAGSYYLLFGDDDHVPEFYNNRSSLATANAINVALNATTSGINAALDSYGKITGKVTTAGGAPLPDVSVWVYDDSTPRVCVGEATSDASGVYTATQLEAGIYYLLFEKVGYVSEFYNNKSSLATADAVNVALNATMSNINISLDALIVGSIAGRVTSATGGAPLPDATARAYTSTASAYSVAFASTDASGAYTMTGLPPGRYYLGFTKAGYLPLYYNNKSSLAVADAIVVTANAVVSQVNAALSVQPGSGAIAGRVTSAPDGAPLEAVYVKIYTNTASFIFVASASTNVSGAYTVTGLPAGQYYVGFDKPGYVSRYYNNRLALAPADPVTVTSGATTQNVNAALAPVGSSGGISGRVSASASGALLRDVGVKVYDSKSSANPVAFEYTDASGAYTVTDVTPGVYYVGFTGSSYTPEFYNNKPTLAAADPV